MSFSKEPGSPRALLSTSTHQRATVHNDHTQSQGLKHQKTRNLGIDALRIFSIFAVVFGHVFGSVISNPELLSQWRMPLFFVLSGFFFTPERSVQTEISKRWKSLGVPYLVWSCVVSVFVLVVLWGKDQEIMEHLLLGWYGGARQSVFWMAFWFISVMFAAVVLRRYLERFPLYVPLSVSIFGLAVAEYFPHQVLGQTPLGIGLALPVMFYLLAGEMIRGYLLPHLQRLSTFWVGFVGLLLIIAGLLATLAGVATHSIKASNFGDFLISPLVAVGISLGAIMVFATWVDALTQRSFFAQRVIFDLVRTGTATVLFHGIVLIPLIWAEFGGHWAKFLVTLIVSMAFASLINRTPLAPWLSGIPQIRPADRPQPTG